MTGTTRSSQNLDPRRRRALFRAWHRGTREMDLLLGPFADAHIERLSDHDLADFEVLMEASDGDLYAWIVGRTPVAANFRFPVFDSIVAFHARAPRLPSHDKS